MRILSLLIIIVAFGFSVSAKIVPARYDIPKPLDSIVNIAGTLSYSDSVLSHHEMLNSTNIINDVEVTHKIYYQTPDFLLFIILLVILGLIRVIDPKYFFNLWRAFANPALNSRHSKEMLEDAGLPDFLMNVFFTFSFGVYLFFLIKTFYSSSYAYANDLLMICLLIVGVAVIYLAKYFSIRFSGWAFRIETITENYLFNVFLINKIIGVAILPVAIFIAFSAPIVAQQIAFISIIVVGLLVIMRYIRSRQIFNTFLQYGKFHFFLYLCASELLPLAVLMKLLMKGLLNT